jgi:hypothetical protein
VNWLEPEELDKPAEAAKPADVDDGWLDELSPEQIGEIVSAAVFDDTSPRDTEAKPPVGLPANEARLVVAMRAAPAGTCERSSTG